MMRYVTRHGQVANYVSHEGGHLYPPGDPPLSELGREQARRLGIHMRQIGFHGRIICSPFMRTLETAELVAKETGCPIVPFAPIREIFKGQESADNFRGLTLEQIREKYDYIDPEARLAYPWWYGEDGQPHGEYMTDVHARVYKGLEPLERIYADTDLLLVGHSASARSMLNWYKIPQPAYGPQTVYNCSLSFIDRSGPKVKYAYADTSYMGYENATSNFMHRQQEDEAYFAEDWPHELSLPEGIREIQGLKILHLGDTNSRFYPCYRKLIEEVKPDIILHTGDMADEVKAGRIPGTRYEYVTKIKWLLDAMNASGARLIIVPGSNDLPDEIRKLSPKAELYPVNTVLTLDGIECRVGHQVSFMTFDKDWSFYGHGLTGDCWRPENNVPGKPCRFDSSFGSFVYCLSEGKFFHIATPRPF